MYQRSISPKPTGFLPPKLLEPLSSDSMKEMQKEYNSFDGRQEGHRGEDRPGRKVEEEERIRRVEERYEQRMRQEREHYELALHSKDEEVSSAEKKYKSRLEDL